MQKLIKLLDTVVLEGQHAISIRDAADYNFMRSASRVMRKAELTFGTQCIIPIIDLIADKDIDGPSIRLFLLTLRRLIPTRQSVFEKHLEDLFPSWRNALQGNPQETLPEEFHIASMKACQQEINFPVGLIAAIEKATQSNYPDVVIAALKFLEYAGIRDSIEIVRKLINSKNESIRVASILTAARLSTLDKSLNVELFDLMLNPMRSISERKSASEVLLINSSLSVSEEVIDFIKHTLLARNDVNIFYDTLLDSTNTTIFALLGRFISENGIIANLSQSTLRRIQRTRNMDAKLRNLSLNTLLEQKEISKQFIASNETRYGLIAHRNSDATAAFVGHACISINENEVIDCSTSRGSNAVQIITFNEWKSNLECWGLRSDDDHSVDLQKAVNRAHEINSWRTEYDANHLNQKGEWIKGWFCTPKYWESDCVGFTEHCYEYAGGDPTPSEFESGAGWPLTVREQRDNLHKVFNC